MTEKVLELLISLLNIIPVYLYFHVDDISLNCRYYFFIMLYTFEMEQLQLQYIIILLKF